MYVDFTYRLHPFDIDNFRIAWERLRHKLFRSAMGKPVETHDVKLCREVYDRPVTQPRLRKPKPR
jgi:hypothetical protein